MIIIHGGANSGDNIAEIQLRLNSTFCHYAFSVKRKGSRAGREMLNVSMDDLILVDSNHMKH